MLDSHRGPEFKFCDQCGAKFHRDKRCTWRHWGKAKFCSRMCATKRGAQLAAERRLPMEQSFARWFDKGDGCWEWKGALDKDGYGIFSHEGKTYRAAKTALAFDGRPVPRGHYACHDCDNPPCVRPDHLYPGAPAQNAADMVRRGRVSRGEKRRGAKITEADVVAIRSDPRPSSAVAPTYGITASNVQAIRRRQTWRHVA